MIDITDIFPGCIIVAHDGLPVECFPPRCECGCSTSGLDWAKHNYRAACRESGHPQDFDRYEYFSVVREAASREPSDSRVMRGWVVRKVGGDFRICGGHGRMACPQCFTPEQIDRMVNDRRLNPAACPSGPDQA